MVWMPFYLGMRICVMRSGLFPGKVNVNNNRTISIHVSYVA